MSLPLKPILSLDFLEMHKCVIDSGHRCIQFPSHGISLSLDSVQVSLPSTVGLILKHKVVVPTASELEVMVESEDQIFNHSWILAGSLLPGDGSCHCHSSVTIRVLNPRNKEQWWWRKGTRVAVMEPLLLGCSVQQVKVDS